MKRYFAFLFFSVASLYAQQFPTIDFIKCDAFVKPDFNEKSISGTVEYEFVVHKKIDTISIDAVAMDFDEVKINGKNVKFVNSGKALKVFKGYKKGKNKLTFNYSAKPKQTLYFVGTPEDYQIWTQGQGKYTSHWLPSFDDVNEKVIFNLNISSNDSKVLANGELESTTEYPPLSAKRIWNYSMKKPMASYLIMLAIGNFVKQTETTSSGTTLEYYLDRKDSLKFEPTYRHSKQIFEFLEQEIGIKYPWEIYRQVPVRDFLYAGMENTTSTIFAQDFVVDSIGYNDKRYLNVNAHELAHQWFGDLVTAKESKHHWLQEGFATYYALLAEQSVFGDDYFYYQLWEMARQLEQAKATDTEPVLSEKASSLTYYKKGAWVLHALRSDIGAENFKKAVKTYLEKYAYKNVNTDEFLAEIQKVSPDYDIASFKKSWLETAGFDFNGVQKYLSGNQFLNQFNEILNQKQVPFQDKKDNYEKLMQSNVYSPVKEAILYQCELIPFEEKKQLIALALATDNIKVRQAVAETTNFIPFEFRDQFTALLNDQSYITREIVLFKLWKRFKENQLDYIQLSNDWEGLNYNLKIANLTLKLITENVADDEKALAITGLEKLTQEPYEMVVRESAIETLLVLKIPSEQALISILDATMHHKWQFVKFGKDKIRRLLSDENGRKDYLNLIPKLSEKQQERLSQFLKETE